MDFVLQKYVRFWKVLIGIFPSSITTLFLKSVLAYTFFTHEENRNLLFSNFQKFQHTILYNINWTFIFAILKLKCDRQESSYFFFLFYKTSIYLTLGINDLSYSRLYYMSEQKKKMKSHRTKVLESTTTIRKKQA